MNINQVNLIIQESGVDTNLISDSYHTFGELYEHRIALFIELSRILVQTGRLNKYDGFKSRKHNDGTEWKGWFIAGIKTSNGYISYHIPVDRWKECKLLEIDQAPEWDGYTSDDIIKRLKLL